MRRASGGSEVRGCRVAGGQVAGAALDPAAHPAAVQLLSSGTAPAASQGDLLLGIDMTLLHRYCLYPGVQAQATDD